MMRWTDIREDREPHHYRGTITFFAGAAKCRVTPEGQGLYLDKVYTGEDNRGRGDATKAINKALAYADSLGASIYLVAVPDHEEDTQRLIAFYKRFGFKVTSDNMMTRPAQ
jgi:GNAT superfamily N-acetyltransferase